MDFAEAAFAVAWMGPVVHLLVKWIKDGTRMALGQQHRKSASLLARARGGLLLCAEAAELPWHAELVAELKVAVEGAGGPDPRWWQLVFSILPCAIGAILGAIAVGGPWGWMIGFGTGAVASGVFKAWQAAAPKLFDLLQSKAATPQYDFGGDEGGPVEGYGEDGEGGYDE